MSLVLAAVYTLFVLAVPARRRIGMAVRCGLCGLAGSVFFQHVVSPPDGIHPLVILLFTVVAAAQAVGFALRALLGSV